MLNRIADRMEQNLELLAYAETIDNGKPIRETLAADIPLAIDHFRYFAGCVRAQEGSLAEIDDDTVAYHFHEPLGVVGQIIPWNFPILMAAWKLAPALAAGNCVVLKPAEQTPRQHPGADGADRRSAAAGRAQRGQRLRPGSGQAAGPPTRIAKIAFTGETTTGRLIMQYASAEPHPGDAGAGRQVAQHLLRRRHGGRRRYLRQGDRGLRHVRAQPGRGLHLPVARADPGEASTTASWSARSSAWRRSARAIRSTPTTMVGAQASAEQMEKILSYIDIGRAGGRRCADRRRPAMISTAISPTATTSSRPCFKGHNKMRVFQEEIFGPVRRRSPPSRTRPRRWRSPTTRSTAWAPASGPATATAPTAWAAASRPAGCGPTATTLYPAHAAFGGYKQSGIGRETHHDDARPLPADQEPAGELQPRRPGLLLSPEAPASPLFHSKIPPGARGLDMPPRGTAGACPAGLTTREIIPWPRPLFSFPRST